MTAEAWDKCQARKSDGKRCYGDRRHSVDGVWLCGFHLGTLRARPLFVFVVVYGKLTTRRMTSDEIID